MYKLIGGEIIGASNLFFTCLLISTFTWVNHQRFSHRFSFSLCGHYIDSAGRHCFGRPGGGARVQSQRNPTPESAVAQARKGDRGLTRL